ncbi:hypothetical protein [Massilia glaciei]|uniref:Uncharacterized protein n=1 Tax=Massilia glaciei TaxID=1524097 RepID=A0A2U2HLD5_9BURK|nr:hypothetical protein [Massilia glaciei]PWF48303.1 hypothetical protein C7C56_012120 [Massilia glaciei]
MSSRLRTCRLLVLAPPTLFTLLTLLTMPASAATVATFSPRAAVQEVDQVRASFSDPMVGMGDTRAGAPLEIDCALDGHGHWVDQRNWVWDVRPKADEIKRDALSCVFNLKAGLRTLAGKPVQGERRFDFKLPALSEAQTLRIVGQHPQHWQRAAEDQTFLLRFSRPLKSFKPALFCDWGIQAHESVVVQDRAATMRAALGAQWKDQLDADAAILAVRCPRPLPSGATIRIGMDRGGLKPALAKFKIRPAFAATISCQSVPATGACTPYEPIELIFNAEVSETFLAAIRLSSPDGARAGAARVGHFHGHGSPVSKLTFAGPHRHDTRFSISYPAGIADREGRTAPPWGLPAGVLTSAHIPTATFSGPSFAVARDADSSAGLLFTHGARPLAMRELLVGAGSDQQRADQDMLRWMQAYQMAPSDQVHRDGSLAHARASLLDG